MNITRNYWKYSYSPACGYSFLNLTISSLNISTSSFLPDSLTYDMHRFARKSAIFCAHKIKPQTMSELKFNRLFLIQIRVTTLQSSSNSGLFQLFLRATNVYKTTRGMQIVLCVIRVTMVALKSYLFTTDSS